jgi:hypothetical protein
MTLVNYVIKAYEGVKFNLYAVLLSVLNGREWSVSCRTFMAVEGYSDTQRVRGCLHTQDQSLRISQ